MSENGKKYSYVAQLNLVNKSALGKLQPEISVICEWAKVSLDLYLSQEFLRSFICCGQRKMNVSILWNALGI